MKRWISNSFATAVAVGTGFLTVAVSLKYLKEPDAAIDWIVLALSGVMTGTIAFFVVWGHFQRDPKPESNP